MLDVFVAAIAAGHNGYEHTVWSHVLIKRLLSGVLEAEAFCLLLWIPSGICTSEP